MKIENTIQKSFTQLSTAKRINSATDDASGLAISEKLKSQINGYEQGSNNALAAKDLSNTAEGALSSINDSLQRIRDIAVQASNGTYTASDKVSMQDEINQLKKNIQDTAKNTEFNTIKVLDGSFSGQNIASGPSGTGQTMSIQNTSLETLGIANFDVTQNFDLTSIDNAISQVSESRSNLGSISNSMDYLVNSNNISSANLSSADNQISGIDMEKALAELKNQQLQQKIQIYAQQSKMNQGASVLNLLK